MNAALKLLSPLLLLACTGCVKFNIVVRLNEDGSARVTEVVEFTAKVMTLEKQLDLGYKVADCLSAEAVQKRASQMGEDVKVVSRQVEDTPEGGKRMTVVYNCPEINELRVCSIPFGLEWNKYWLRFRYDTARSDDWNRIDFDVYYENLFQVKNGPTGDVPLAISELELQKVRKLLPVFKNMLEGFDVSVKIEAFELNKWLPITEGQFGGGTPDYVRRGGRATLLHLTDKMLLTSDDALMVLVPWRQEGNERVMRDLVDLELHIPSHVHKNYHMDWQYTQRPTGRVYH